MKKVFYFQRCIHFEFEPVSIKTHPFFSMFLLPFFTYTLLLRIFLFFIRIVFVQNMPESSSLMRYTLRRKNQFKRGNCKKNLVRSEHCNFMFNVFRSSFIFYILHTHLLGRHTFQPAPEPKQKKICSFLHLFINEFPQKKIQWN